MKDAMDLDLLEFYIEGNPFLFSGGQNLSQQQLQRFPSDIDAGYPGWYGVGDGEFSKSQRNKMNKMKHN